MRERVKYLSVLFFIAPSMLFGQTGTIKGTVADQNTKETLIGATVMIQGTTTGTITDFDGNYRIDNLRPGTYNVECSYVSYDTKVINNITVQDNQETVLDFSLAEAVTAINEVKVVAKKKRESEMVLLLERKEASVAVESIGSKELSRKGAGNVGAGIKKISGISMIGDKQLFVRGLGDRYNSVELNNLPITSPDPTKKVIKLDLFSSDIVEALSVTKVYNAQKFADYTGALINIDTKDYPITPFLSINYGVTYNTQSSLKDFKRMNSVGNDFLGLSTSERQDVMPQESKNYDRTKRFSSEIFGTDFKHMTNNALPGQSFNVSGGKLFSIGKRQLGTLFSISFDNDYRIYTGIPKKTIRKDGTNEDSWSYDSYEYSTNLSALLSVNYKHNSENTISYNFFYLNSSNDMFKEIIGRDNENRNIYSQYNEYENHNLINNQLFGRHTISKKLVLTWGGSLALSSSGQPDLRQIKLQNTNDGYNFYVADQQGTLRLNLGLKEYSSNGRLGIEYKMSDKGILNFGAQGLYVNREFNTYIYYYDVNGISDITIDDPATAGNLLSSNNFNDGLLLINNGSTWDNKYLGSLMVFSGYTNYIHTFYNKLNVDLGLRAEISDMEIEANSTGGNPIPVSLAANNLFPSLNVRYSVNDKTNLRFAASRTITRPSFHEKSPAKIPPRPDDDAEYGNSELINSYSNNLELKYEIFPQPHELFAIGVYGKTIENPIERITRPTGGGTIYSYQNTQNGIAAGIEAEVKKKLNNLFAGMNLALIYTHVTIPEGDNGTNKERQLQGASPFLINADLGYVLKFNDGKSTSSLSVVYNVFGERIYSVGSDGKGDIYEMPKRTLDLLIRNKLSKNLELNLKAKNILNAQSIYEQDYYNSESGVIGRIPIEVYSKGIEFSIGLGYTF